MKTVRIYTIDGCPYCIELKEMLTKDNIEFVEVNVDLEENQIEYNELNRITKSDDVPIIRVGKNLLVPNISFQSINEAATLTKQFLA